MRQSFWVLLLSILIFGSGERVWSEYKVFDMQFQGPTDMTKTDIGTAAGEIWEFEAHKGDTNGQDSLRVVFYLFPVQAEKDLGGVTGLMNYGKTMILATSKPAEKTIKRKILGKKIKGECLRTSIPGPSYTEAYVIRLRHIKQYLFLGIKAEAAYSAEELESIIKGITESLQILP